MSNNAVRKFDKLRKFILFLASVSSLILFFNKFGKEQELFKDKNTLVWYLKPCGMTPLDAKMESTFNNLFALYIAADDPKVTNLSIVVSEPIKLGTSSMQEMLNVISAFKHNGKSVSVWMQNIEGIQAFLLFSAADKRFLSKPSASVALEGLFFTEFFKKRELKKKKIDVWGEQYGDFKGGLQSDLAQKFDYYSYSNMYACLEDLSYQIKEELAKNFGCEMYVMEQKLSQKYHRASDLLAAGISHEYGYYYPQKDEITLAVYAKKLAKKMEYAKHLVPVVMIDPIVSLARYKIYVKKLNEIANAEDVKVVVIYIYCLGGSADAADLTYEAILNLRKKGKYVIAFVDLAFSAGYYIACACDRIITRPGALVGSIGAYLKLNNVLEHIKEQGVDFDSIAVYGDEINQFNLSQERKAWLKKDLQIGGREFAMNVGKQRNIPEHIMLDIAQGQIYSGLAGKHLNLADSLGGFSDLIDTIYYLHSKESFVFQFWPNIRMFIELEEAEPFYTAHSQH